MEALSLALEYRELILAGLLMTVQIFLVSLPLSLALGTAAGLMRTVRNPFLSRLAGLYVEFFRNTPPVVQLFFWYFAAARTLGFDNFSAAVLGLSFYTSAYIAEVIRSGLRSIPAGQTEAGLASGLTYFQLQSTIILPQTFRIIIPPLTNQFLNLLKNSSIAMTIAVQELMYTVQDIDNLTFRGFEAATIAVVIYLFLSLTVAGVMALIDRFLSKEKTAAGPLGRGASQEAVT